MSTKESLQFWTIVLLGLFYISVRCDARAVNVSNTWTMPQEGLNVFYRFFRDRISWFEADAVCQFHHANLVTVDNSFQFDATRDLLRELDVNDIVWIGLMRPESSERFMWSNSRPLVTDTGYWAESLPLMDAPLCAVIDPIRDYRWHALRCGGPETASFLCEMPVPSWAETCILKDMPNLTMQYMADTASIELIRNCEEEGLLRQTCKGKQDRERALRELICPRERLEAQRINDITNSHFKSLQIINSIRTDNNENNDIELLPLGLNYGANSEKIPEQSPTEKNTVQRLIEQFNVDELMQADEPLSGGGFKMFGEKPIPVKKDAVAAKRTIVIRNYPRKTQLQKQSYKKPSKKQTKQQLRELALDDMMMGDQPQHDGEPEMLEHVLDEEDDVSNEIMEALPHKKKILAQDLKTMATITERPVESEKKKVHESVEEKNIERRQQQVNESDMTTDATTTTVTEVGTTAAAAASSTAANITPTTTTTTTSTTTTTTTTAASSSSSSSPTATVPAIATTFPTTVVTSEELGFSYSPTITSSTYGVSSPSTTTITSSSTSLQDLPNRTNITFAHESQQQTTIVAPATATVPPATIGHPMHPQQPRSNIITEETQHPHVKESADNSHFIPPMLLVKSHYVPPAKHEHEHEHEHKHGHEQHGNRQDSDSSGDGEGIEQRLTAATTTTITVATSTETDAIKQPAEHEHHRQHQSTATVSASSTSTTMETVTRYANVADKTDFADVVIISTTVPAADVTTTTNSEVVTAKDTHASIIDVSSSNPTKGNADNTRKKTPTTILQPVNISDESLDETSTTTTTTTTMPVTTTAQISIEDSITQTSTIQSMPNETATTTRPPEGSSVVALLLKENEKSINSMTSKVTNEQQLAVKHETAAAAATTTTKAVLSAVAEVQAEVAAGIVDTLQISHGKEEVIIIATTDAPATTTSTTTTVTTTTAAPIKATTKHVYAHIHATRKPTKATHISTTTEEPATTHNFLNEETEPPFKPNRHRELTQPETVSYFKKILG